MGGNTAEQEGPVRWDAAMATVPATAAADHRAFLLAGAATGAPALVVIGGTSSDHLRTPDSPAVQTVGGAGLYASLGASAAEARVGLVGLVSDDLAPKMTARLRDRVDDASLVRIPGARLHFDIAYDTSWQAEHAVDGAEIEKLLDHRLSPTSIRPRPGSIYVPPGRRPHRWHWPKHCGQTRVLQARSCRLPTRHRRRPWPSRASALIGSSRRPRAKCSGVPR